MISAKQSYIWSIMFRAKPPLLVFFVLAVAAAGCATAPPESFAISNLQYGTMCGSPDLHVCTQTTDIAIDGKGHCVFDHNEIPCTWYGFSFDYVPKTDGVTIDCDVLTDYKATLGNPQGIVEKDSEAHRFEVPLSGGRFVNPQYMGYRPFDGVRHLTETCSYRGRKLFEFTFNLHYVGTAS
jgi:hypothetical protein